MTTKYHFQVDEPQTYDQEKKYDLKEPLIPRSYQESQSILNLKVKQGVTTWNIVAMTLILFTVLQFLLFYEVSLIFLLQSKDNFNLTTNEAQTAVNDIIFWSQLLTLIFDLLAGSTHDLLGRKLTIFIGFTIACSAFVVQPWLSAVYPGILICRSIVQIGLSGPASTPLVADYVKQSSRGKASAYVGLLAGIGVIFGIFVMFGSTKHLPYTYSYAIEAIFTFIIAVFLLFAVQDRKIDKKHVQSMPLKERITVKSQQLKGELSSKIELSICLIGSILCRMLNVISTVYLNLWISSFYDRDSAGQLQAKALSSRLSGISMTLALIFTCIVGVVSDRVRASTVFIAVFGISTIGVILFIMIDSPHSWLTYLSVICFNIGNQTQNIAIITLLYKTIEKGTRGTILGLNNAVSAIGILIITKFGGYLYQSISIQAPFVFVGILDAVFIVGIIFLRITGKFKK
eukprot:403363997